MALPVQISDNRTMLPATSSVGGTTATQPPSTTTPSSLAASRPRRSSSNNNNTTTTTTSTSGTRSNSMNRHGSRSRGYSNTTSTSPYSPYSLSPSSHHSALPSSSFDKRQQTKFERLFGNGATSGHHSPSAGASSSSNALYGTSPSTSALSATPPSAAVNSPHSLRSSGIALTRRAAAAAASASSASGTQQRGIGGNYNSNGNGHADITTSTEHDDDEDDEDGGVIGYSSSPGGANNAKLGGGAGNSLGLGGLHNPNNSIKKVSPNGNESSTSSSKKEEKLLRCERCHKVYHHPQSLIKHRWQHTEIWSDASRYGLSKHATVQALEAAVILANPDTLRLLPNDKSHWPAAVSPPTSGLLGSERVNIEVLRKQAEVNERELDEQEKAGNLRKGPPTISSAQARRAAASSSMQVYSKSMPANVGRRRSGLAFSLHNDMMDDDEEEEDDDEEDDIDGVKDDATMTTETNDERGDDGDEDDDDSTESEDESVIAGMNVKNGVTSTAQPTEMESMDQDMFSLDISSSSPYARPSPLPPVSENGSSTHIPTSTRSGLSYSRKNYTTSLVAPLAERYTFLPTIPSSSSLHISDNMSNMTAIPSASIRTRNRSSSHTRSTRGYDEAQDRSTRETSTSSSTDESGVSASASVGAGTTGGSGDEAVSHATKDSGYISAAVAQDVKPDSSQQQHVPAPQAATTPHRPAIDPAQTATISMSAPVLGFFTERSPVSSFSARGSGAPTTRQQAGHASPRFGPVDHSPTKVEPSVEGTNGFHTSGTTAQAIPGYTPLEAQAAEILSSSQQSQSGPRSFSQTHFGSSYARSPGYHPYRSPSPFPSTRQLPSSSLSQAAQQGNAIHSSSPSTTTGQAYSFGQAPLGTSYRSTSFNVASPAAAQPKQFPMSPLARPADTNDEDDDDMMDMDL
ncbi:hypothetical protein P389DRAFT_72447 [Cystobasidium minutum MCA 4210]|uniref:uncharacterized protein n=1 Tax=Cystobasidium minutum MCA 4210 TaxID=1397322 RepID=UPI0034CF37FB|eukprot:jgi/Rhomi1/72447/CE72446_750